MKHVFPVGRAATVLLAAVWLVLPLAGWSEPPVKTRTKKIAMIIPFKMYESDELRVPKGIFEKAGMKVTVASSQPGTATTDGDKIAVDVVLDQLKVEDYDAIVFVGGYGTPEYFDNKAAHAVAQKAVKENKILAAICWAPIILAKAGVLKGRKATSSTDRHIIAANGGEFTFASVVTDGNIITADGPSAAEEFGTTIAARLKKK